MTLEQRLKQAICLATLAPSGHNSQPWRFTLNVAQASLDLWADYARRLPVIDPQDRELIISCGASLLNLRVGLSKLGLPYRYELLPGEPGQLARVHVEPWLQCERSERALARAIALRRTYRFPFLTRPVDPEVVARLDEAARQEGARTRWVQAPEERRELGSLIRAADLTMATDPHFREELSAWLRSSHTVRPDGVPGYALHDEVTLFDDFASSLAPLLTRFLNWGPQAAAHDEALAVEAPLLLVLSTPADTPADWLKVGQALQRMLLTGALCEVQGSFLNQPLELPELRERVSCDGVPQLIIRLGYQQHAQRPTPRRPLEEVLSA